MSHEYEDNDLFPNTTQIPNVIFDECMSRLTGSQFKIVMMLARRAYGFAIDSPTLDISRLAFLTGVHESQCRCDCEHLSSLGIVTTINPDLFTLNTGSNEEVEA